MGGTKPGTRKAAAAKNAPRLVAWEVTKRCNLACAHCRASSSDEAADELTTKEGLKLLKNIALLGAPVVILTGGEPMLRADIYELAAAGRKLGLPMALATNGSLVDDETAERIIAAGIHRCAISLDGVTSATHDRIRRLEGSFDTAIKAASTFRRHEVEFQINTSVTRDNERELSQMAGLVQALGAAAWHIFMVVPVGRAAGIGENLLDAARYNEILHWLVEQAPGMAVEIKPTCAPQYYRMLRQHAASAETQHQGRAPATRGCLAGTAFAFISSTGDVQPCGYFPVVAGNVREHTFLQIWRSSALFHKLRDVEEYKGRCGHCDFFETCGGCRARALAVSGDFMADDTYCSYQPRAGEV